jgi:murein DD-endopeptidase MepM/ murein hydrolase activator NlpD
MRERLLSRAQRAAAREPEQEVSPFGDLDEIGKDSSRTPAAELPRASARADALSHGQNRLSPNLIAVFGTAMGVAVVTSLCAVAMNVLARGDAPLLTVRSATASAGSPALAAEAPRPILVKKPARIKQPGPWRIKDAAGDPSTRVIEGKVGTDPFLKAVQSAGIKEKEAYRLITAFRDVKSFDKCNKTDRFTALVDRASSRIKAFEYSVSAEEVYQAREGADGLLKGTKLDLKVTRGEVTGSLVYDGSSFDGSAERAGFDPGLSRVVAKALEGHLALEELEAGDVVRVIAQEVAVLGEFARYSGVEAVEIRRKGKEKPQRFYYFDAAGERGYYDAEGRAPYEGGWRKPVPNARVTSHFNLKRLHPVLKQVKPHLGTDFGAPPGTPIGAASFGTISFIGYAGATGNFVKIDHPGGISTGYAHLSRFEPGLKVGDKVKRLQTIGYVGSTGRSTGPHLHFSAQRNGEFFDPLTLNLDGLRTVSKEQRAAFDAVVKKYNAALDAIPLPPPLPEPPKPEAPAAAAEVVPAAEPGLDDGDGDELGSAAAPPPAAAPAAGGAAAPAAAAPVPAKPAGKSQIYLTDKELLELQGRSDDGEVAE